MSRDAGPLIIIGGHEEKEGERAILASIAKAAAGGRLVIATIASQRPEGYFAAYEAGFAGLDTVDLVEIYVESRDDVDAAARVIAGASGLFFTGGDQQRLLDQISGTAIEVALRALHARGGVIAGTSAGASALGATMIVAGAAEVAADTDTVKLAAALGLVPGVIIDQHFAERGRIGRLVAAVAQNPRLLGLGIDENTAICVEGGGFVVLGKGAVTVIDGRFARPARARRRDAPLSIQDLRLHLLAAGDRFSLDAHGPDGSLPNRNA